MTFIAVPIRVDRADAVGEALERARHAAAEGAGLIEWRMDELVASETQPTAVAAARRLIEHSPRSCIVTCRLQEEGGGYGGSQAARWDFLDGLLAAGHRPRYIDVELAAAQRSPGRLERLARALGDETTLILSAHDFDDRPPDLLRRVEAMAADPRCGVMKLAWRARSLRDNLEVFDLLADRQKPMVALCMGRFGLPSRVLAPKFGGLLTFAALDDEHGTAPGQPTIGELRGRLGFDRVGRSTSVYGVIGWPVEHSRGPHLHNAAFAAAGHDGVYLPLPIPPEPVHLKATLGALLEHETLGFRGASVTLPHKEHVLELARDRGAAVDPACERIGAANTLVVGDDGGLRCLNTDCPAAVDALCAGMGIEPAALRDRRVAVLGAGGAARAVAVGLASAGATVVVFNRTPARAEAMVDDLRARLAGGAGVGTIVSGKPGALGCGCFPVIVNCTSMGMAGGPAPDASPLDTLSDDPVPLDEGVTVLDTVYAPAETPLLREAAARGARTIGGEAMFLRQAALQFEAWTGKPAPAGIY